MTDTATGVQVAGEKGAWAIGYASDMRQFAPEHQLTAFTLDWNSVYVSAAKAVAAGNWKSEERWQGLKEGVVSMAPYLDAIPSDVQQKLNQVEADIAAASCILRRRNQGPGGQGSGQSGENFGDMSVKF